MLSKIRWKQILTLEWVQYFGHTMTLMSQYKWQFFATRPQGTLSSWYQRPNLDDRKITSDDERKDHMIEYIKVCKTKNDHKTK